jgi:hypothetical protein
MARLLVDAGSGRAFIRSSAFLTPPSRALLRAGSPRSTPQTTLRKRRSEPARASAPLARAGYPGGLWFYGSGHQRARCREGKEPRWSVAGDDGDEGAALPYRKI